MNEEQEEMRKNDKEKSILHQKMVKESIVNQGAKFESIVGQAKMIEIELQVKAFLMAWGGIMGSSLRFNLASIEAMTAVMGNIPVRCGMDIMQRPQYIEMQSELCAIRNRLIKQISDRAESNLSTLSPQKPL